MTSEQLTETIHRYKRLLQKDEERGLSATELSDLLLTVLKAEREAKQLGLTKLQLDMMVTKTVTGKRR